MYEWAKNKIKKFSKENLKITKLSVVKTKGLLLDQSKIPTPNEPIFYNLR